MANKKILGLDIGTTSIGWAIVEASEDKPLKDNKYFKEDTPETKTDTNNLRTGLHYKDDIPAVGVRIIPQGKMGGRFDSGKKLNEKKDKTPTKERRDFRSARKTKSRYKLRRDKLCSVLNILGMLPEGSYEKVLKNEKEIWQPIKKKNNKWYTNDKGKRETDIGEALYKLRADALNAKNEISLKDWGRILLHLNQWRGYSSDRFSNSEEELDKDFLSGVVTSISDELEKKYEEDDAEKIKWIKYEIAIDFETPVTIEEKNGDETTEKILSSIKGNLYVQDLKFEKDDMITFSFQILNNETKIKYIQPKPESPGYWKYKYFLLNKDLKDWCKNGGTIGSYFYNHHSQFNKAKENTNVTTNKILSERIRNIVVNRDWYEDEFDKIWEVQYKKNKDKFTPEFVGQCIDTAFKDERVKKEITNFKIDGIPASDEQKLKYLIKDKIIYYQRSWQQSKNKGECRYEKIPDIKKDKEGNVIPRKDGKDHWKGRTVIPRSHPLHQEFKIWQQINNVRIWFHPVAEKGIELMENATICKRKLGKTPTEIKGLLYKRLQQKKEQSWRTFVNELFPDITLIKLKKSKDADTIDKDKYSVNYIKLSKKTKDEQDNPLKGNKTKVQIQEVLKIEDEKWFDETAKNGTDKHNAEKVIEKKIATKKKGTVQANYQAKDYQVSNLQLLWEIIYDITGFHAGNEKANVDLIAKKIRNHFDAATISDEQCALLSKIKFEDSGMGNLSARAIRKMLPLMACEEYAEQYPLNKKVESQIANLILLNQQEIQNEVDDDLKLYSLKEFISDKKARKTLSQKLTPDKFKGLNYWEAAAVVYGSHSKLGVTKRTEDEINESIKNLLTVKPSSMNNPVVEKIVNETLKMVKLLYENYGFDELRIELSRELKNSREEREAIWDAQQNNQKKNKWAKEMLRELNFDLNNYNQNKISIYRDVSENRFKDDFKNQKFNFKEPTKKEIERYILWVDQKYQCPYTGEVLSLTDILTPGICDIDHIIPQARFPDNKFSNKVICRKYVNKDLKKNLLPSEMIGLFDEKEKYRNRRPADDRVKDNFGQYIIKNGEEVRLLSPEKYLEKIEELFPKGGKKKNLFRKSIPEDPITRELKDTQYINRKLREKLGEIFGFDKVWTTTGQVTDMLRNAWHLNEKVMQEILKDRFENFEIRLGSGNANYISNIIFDNPIDDEKTGKEKIVKKFPGFNKRLDHRHHALDAIIVACTKQMHIQNINTLNAKFELKDYDGKDEEKVAQKMKYKIIDDLIKHYNEEGKKVFNEPWQADDFMKQVRDALRQIIVSHKNSNVLISPSKNKEIDKNSYSSFSVRAKLHEETLVGKRKIYDRETKKLTEVPAKRGSESVMSINPEKVIDARTKRYLQYRQELKKEVDEKFKNVKDSKEKQDVNNFTNYPIYYNAIYDIRVKDNFKLNNEKLPNHPWLPLFEFKVEMIDEVQYLKYIHEKGEIIAFPDIERTEKIKNLIKNYGYSYTKENILLHHPLFINENKKIIIKKATVENRKGNEALIEIRPKIFVSTKEKFRVIVTQDKNSKEKHFKYIDHLTALNFRKAFIADPNKELFIKAEFAIPKNEIPDNDKFLFTLSKKDLVYLPDTTVDNINWIDIKALSKNLFTVSSFDEKGNGGKGYILLEKHTFAEPIKLNDANDAHALRLKLIELKEKLEKEKKEYDEEAERLKPIQEEIKQLKEANKIKGIKKDEKTANAEKRKKLEDDTKQNEILLKEHKKEIDMREKEIKNLDNAIAFKPDGDKAAAPIVESAELKNDTVQQKLIKVFTDKLGKKIIPYWEFENGSWNKDDATRLKLISNT